MNSTLQKSHVLFPLLWETEEDEITTITTHTANTSKISNRSKKPSKIMMFNAALQEAIFQATKALTTLDFELPTEFVIQAVHAKLPHEMKEIFLRMPENEKLAIATSIKSNIPLPPCVPHDVMMGQEPEVSVDSSSLTDDSTTVTGGVTSSMDTTASTHNTAGTVAFNMQNMHINDE